MRKPKIAITIGDPAGIGPEIIVKMFLTENLYKFSIPVVIGDLFPLLNAQRIISKEISIHIMKDINDIITKENVINLYDLKNKGMDDIIYGIPQKKAGGASFRYIKTAIDFANSKKIDAIVTAPINKHSIHLAGIKYPGHTEILAKFTKTKKYAMMLAGKKLKVVLVTIHTAIKNVSKELSIKKIFDIIKITDYSLKRDFKIKNPKIGVCALNPHAGENGAFGNEEKKFIIPAIKKAKKEKINVDGPHPSDTIFYNNLKYNLFDAIICMYHDQGLIPLKLLDFDTGVNITLGLPIVRTSPDHGTAYDIAGTNKASSESILSAFKVACQIAKNRKIQN